MNRRAMPLPAALTGLLTLLVAGVVAGCEIRIDANERPTGHEVTQTRDVTAVTRVELRATGTLNLAVGDVPSLSVTASSATLEHVSTTVEGDTLVIDVDGSRRRPGYLEYDLVLPALSSVVLSGSGGVFGALGGGDTVELRIDGSGEIGIDGLSASAVHVAIDGSGDVTLRDVTATDVDVDVAGSGDVKVDGSAEHLRALIPGSGDVHAAKLAAHSGEVTIGGSGDVAVNVSDTLTATIDGSGDISYLGDPQVRRTIDGSGDIERG